MQQRRRDAKQASDASFRSGFASAIRGGDSGDSGAGAGAGSSGVDATGFASAIRGGGAGGGGGGASGDASDGAGGAAATAADAAGLAYLLLVWYSPGGQPSGVAPPSLWDVVVSRYCVTWTAPGVGDVGIGVGGESLGRSVWSGGMVRSQ